MFATIKSNVPLLEVIEKDTGLKFKQSGENYVIEDEQEQGGCPFCGHKDCFKVKAENDQDLNGFYKCFSCDAKGDVIAWRAGFKKIELVDAARELAREYDVTLPRDFSPVQAIMNAAAHYYEVCLRDSCNRPYVELGKKTPLEYQLEVRGHSRESLDEFHVGWSDGGLIGYLESIGFDDEMIDQTGLKNKKTGKDFLPSKVFIYPHYVKGKVSHFTFKDPGKRLAYQIPKKFSLNGITFYNQDSISKSDTVIIVEGENDLISCWDTGKIVSVIGTIGQLSADQLEWMKDNLSNKRVLTIFDPDEAGDKYRIRVEKNRRFYRNLMHVLPPEDKDIDELLTEGRDIEEIIKNNLTVVELEAAPKGTEDLLGDAVPWSDDKANFKEAIRQISSETFEQTGETLTEEELLDTEVISEDRTVVLKRGAYYTVKYKDGEAEYRKISDFHLRLSNVFVKDNGCREREVVFVRENGYRSAPVMVSSEDKISLAKFRVLCANAADAMFTGNDQNLAQIWKMVIPDTYATEVKLTRTAGRDESNKAWVFRNIMVTDSGSVILPDADGVFWNPGHTIGIRPESISKEDGTTDLDRGDIPEILTELSIDEKDELLGGILGNVAKNLNSPGKALTMIGWSYATIYSNLIFDLNRGFPFLFFWGVNGQGKSTVAKWITQDFYGISGHGSTSVPNMNSGIGWIKKSEYYASLPLFVDEVRSDEQTRSKLGVFRSYYDREARTVSMKEGFGVKSTKPRAVFVFNGEDQFEDPATRERCIPIRIPVKNRELQESYRWMEARKHLFTGIVYHWLMEFGEVMRDPAVKESLIKEIRSLDKELLAAGCSQRTSKNWAAVGAFGMRLANKYMPDFNYKEYLLNAALYEATYQKSDTTLMQFWELVEGIKSQDLSKVTDKHVTREGDLVHVWFPPVFKIVQDETRGRFSFSKNAVLSALREEPYYVSDNRKVQMGLEGTRRTVVTLDLTKAPDSVKNIALANA